MNIRDHNMIVRAYSLLQWLHR